MKITRSGANASVRGPEDYFTGTVRIDPMFQAEDPGRVAGSHVTFEPGARTAWHTHPAGQTLIVTFGRGRVQREGGPVEEIRQGVLDTMRNLGTGGGYIFSPSHYILADVPVQNIYAMLEAQRDFGTYGRYPFD